MPEFDTPVSCCDVDNGKVHLQWISTYFGRGGWQVPWELGSYVTKFTITLPTMVMKFRSCKRTSQVQRELSNFSS